mmetsp:Transcript_49333/g.130784  ORF Transcript_49333/g.130784 Transcript_49333/m.130784 type:complete len:616 (-) Transcript_49333:148-1995(-)
MNYGGPGVSPWSVELLSPSSSIGNRMRTPGTRTPPRVPVYAASELGEQTQAQRLTVEALASASKQSTRYRSPSPWNAPRSAMSRVRSQERGASYTLATCASAPLTSARQVQDSVLQCVKKQMDALEDKVGGQMSRLKEGHERLKEVHLARLEEKVTAAEGTQPRLERRLAEMSGGFQGMSDEQQNQIRRVDAMDERWREWRRSLEEEVREKIVEPDQRIQKLASELRVLRASVEEGQRRNSNRIQRLEMESSERSTTLEDASQNLATLLQRLESVEVRVSETSLGRVVSPSSPIGADNSLMMMLQRHLAELEERVNGVVQDQHEAGARVETQEERLRALRTSVDNKDAHCRKVGDRERADVEGRLEQLHKSFREQQQELSDHSERVQMMSKRLTEQEQMCEEFRCSSAQCQALVPAIDNGAFMDALGECAARLEELESHIQMHDFQLSQTVDQNHVSDVKEICEQLQEVAPQMRRHDESIKMLQSQCREHRDDAEALRSSLQRVSPSSGTLDVGIVKDVSKRVEVLQNDMPTLAHSLRSEMMQLVSRAQHEQAERCAEEMRIQLASLRDEVSDSLRSFQDEAVRKNLSLKQELAALQSPAILDVDRGRLDESPEV